MHAASYFIIRSITLQAFQTLRVPIDWAKTWAWVTRKRVAHQWNYIGELLFGPEHPLKLATSSTDLGVVIAYNGVHQLLKITDRLRDAALRLDKLHRQDLKSTSLRNCSRPPSGQRRFTQQKQVC